jgi:hypothetical protein
MNVSCMILVPLTLAGLASVPAMACAQATAPPASVAASASATPPAAPFPAYRRPTQAENLGNYSYDMFGPFAIGVALVEGGIDLDDHTPPEWQLGFKGYAERTGSDFGIESVSTTTRYVLAEAFREDTHYYRCRCKGFFPRLGYAVVGNFIARRGDDGHKVFSVPGLVAPYAGTMTAVYGWYPGRYSGKDAFRMGNYTMLGYVGSNIGLEFLYTSPGSLLARLHLIHARAQDTGTTQ